MTPPAAVVDVGWEGARAARFTRIRRSVWLLLVSGVVLTVDAALAHFPWFVFWLGGFYAGAGVVGFAVTRWALRPIAPPVSSVLPVEVTDA